MEETFVPHTAFIDNAKSFEASFGRKLMNHRGGVKMVDRALVAELVCQSGAVKNPKGTVGRRYVDHVTNVLGYLIAASYNSWDKIKISFREMFPDAEKRTRVLNILEFAGVITLIKRGFGFAGVEGQTSIWGIENRIWEFLTDGAVKQIQNAYNIDERANTKINLKSEHTVTFIDGVNDFPIKKTAEKYPFMIGFQTVYNDFECKTNGRLYHRIQNLKKANREYVLSKLTGMNMVTVDIKSSQLRLLLKVIGRKIGWSEDLYAKLEGVDEIPREIVKLATSVMFNTDGNKSFMAAFVCGEKRLDFGYEQAKCFEESLNKLSNGVIKMTKGIGLRLMNIEGRMQTEMLKWALENDLLWFPMHDGGHCPDWAAEAAERKMEEIIDRIISEMTMEERAEILGVSVDDLLLIQAGITPKREQQTPKQKRFANPEEQQTDSADDAFIREFLNSRKAA